MSFFSMGRVKRALGHPDNDVRTVSVSQWWHSLSVARQPKQTAIDYASSLFPILGWIGRYNFGWLSGDAVAGLTVGIVAVPQSMSYAVIATLPPEYGLYSSFVGVLVYAFFATSKDVNIGPVAVMSLTVASIIRAVNHAHPGEWANEHIATTIAFLCGFIVLGVGLLRIGWLVEFIPAPAVSGFMSGSAISIAATQLPALFGVSGFDTRGAPYKVIINVLKRLGHTKMDAAFGITGLVSLYLMRWGFQKLGARYPRWNRFFFFMTVMRNGFVVIILTFASWLYTRHRRDAHGKYPIKILGTVPRGFQHLGPPNLDTKLMSALVGQLPVATIILLLEHIAISKSFGRVNGYKINPNQELIAIGVTNTLGTLFGAYPATGSFSRSALQSKSGSRTPGAGFFSAVIVIVALYGLTPAFYWIPSAALSAVIIHAVADLVAMPSQVYQFWRVSPLEFLIFLAGLFVTIFSTVENGIYTAIIASLVLLLVRVARPRGHFLGRLDVHGEDSTREVYVPLKPPGGVMNPNIRVHPPEPGVIIYRFEESFLYPNSSLVNDAIVAFVKEHTRRGKDMSNVKASDRPWNDPGPKNANGDASTSKNKPLLHAIVLDFSAVSHLDTTGTQALIDTRTEVERWADREVEFHFASISSPWIRRALVAAGFGLAGSHASLPHEIAPVIPYVERDISDPEATADHYADLTKEDLETGRFRVGSVNSDKSDFAKEQKFSGGSSDPNTRVASREQVGAMVEEIERASMQSGSSISLDQSVDDGYPRYGALDTAPLVPKNTPMFHFDLHAAVRAASRPGAREPTLGDTRN